MRSRAGLLSALLFAGSGAAARSGAGAGAGALPQLSYRVTIDSAAHDVVRVTLHIAPAPRRLRLAMKVHPEYDARFWRYVHFDGAAATRVDTTLWSVVPDRNGDVSYEVRFPPDTGVRRAWRTAVRDDGALLNPPDVLLYLPDFVEAPATVTLDAPRSWRVATSLDERGSPRVRWAADAAELLDAPILLGRLREWSFVDRGTTYGVDYWPLPNAAPFDTMAFVDGLRRLTGATSAVFEGLRYRRFAFLIQDGANDALEHRASLTIGVPSGDLAADPHAHMAELAHEFFHIWNLVAIHPDTYADLGYVHSPPTPGLWWGEGVTMYYADVLPRRAGLVKGDSGSSRAAHLADLIARYLAAPWRTSVSPVAASLAASRSAISDSNATDGYYLQGELLGNVIDAAIRDSTRDRRGIDDVQRALYRHARDGHGVTEGEWESVADSVCACRLESLFARVVRAPGLIDAAPVAARLGWRMIVSDEAAVDARGVPLPDIRIAGEAEDSVFRLVIRNAATPWARAGLVTGDVLVSLDGARPTDFGSLYSALRRLGVGDTARVVIRRGSVSRQIAVPVTGYTRPHIQFVDAEGATTEQRERRARWLAGAESPPAPDSHRARRRW